MHPQNFYYFIRIYHKLIRDQTSNNKITLEIFNRYLIGKFPQISYSILVPSPHNFDVTHLLAGASFEVSINMNRSYQNHKPKYEMN